MILLGTLKDFAEDNLRVEKIDRGRQVLVLRTFGGLIHQRERMRQNIHREKLRKERQRGNQQKRYRIQRTNGTFDTFQIIRSRCTFS